MTTKTIFIPDRSRPGLTTAACGADVQQGAAGNYATAGQLSFSGRSNLRIGYFNVRSLRSESQQISLAKDASFFKLDIMCVSESRLETGVHVLRDDRGKQFMFFSSGSEVPSSQAGVGLLLSSKASSAVHSWSAVSERMVWCRFNSTLSVHKNSRKKRGLFIISVYAPHNSHDNCTKDSFYSNLSTSLSEAHQGDVVIIAGDFNACVGPVAQFERDVGGLGSLRDVPRNDNGSRLVEFSHEKSMWIASTGFMHRRAHTITFKPTRGSTTKQLDHILISRCWRRSVCNVRSHWGTSTDSDHSLVICSITVNLNRRRVDRCTSKSLPMDPSSLEQKSTALKYSSAVDKKTQEVSDRSAEIEEKWSFLKDTLITSANSVCPKKQGKFNDRVISTETLSLIEKRRGSGGKRRKRLNKLIRSSYRRDWNKWASSRAESVQNAFNRGDVRSMYKEIGKLSRYRSIESADVLQDKSGKVLTDRNAKLSCWVDHFSDQFSAPPPTELLETGDEVDEVSSISVEPPTDEEIIDVIKNMKSGKAAGSDEIFPEMLKMAPTSWLSLFGSLMRDIWQEGSVPKSWKKSVCIPIHKKGSRQECKNYRGISLIQVAVKVLESVLARRMNDFRENQLREEQGGFRRGRSCVDHIFVVRQVLEARKAFGRPTLTCFLDIKGAFDSVDRSTLWRILSELGIPARLVNLIQSMYRQQTTVVRAYGNLSEEFHPTTGVWQGSVLSPHLFTWVMDRVVKAAIQSCSSFKGVDIGNDFSIKSLEYADDVVVFASSVEQLQVFLDSLSAEAGKVGLHFSPSKCAILPQDIPSNQISVKLGDTSVPVVHSFVYLGSTVEPGGGAGVEMSRRIGLAWSVMKSLKHIWNSRSISLRVKGQVYQACVRSVLLYASETWTLTSNMLDKISSFDSRCLRWINRTKWHHFMPNIDVQKAVFGLQSQKIGDVKKVVQERQLRWLGHVTRMRQSRLPLKVVSAPATCGWKRSAGCKLHWRMMMKQLTLPLCRDGRGRISFDQKNERRFDFNPWLCFIEMFSSDRALWRQITSCIVNNKSLQEIGDVALLRDSVVGLRTRNRRR